MHVIISSILLCLPVIYIWPYLDIVQHCHGYVEPLLTGNLFDDIIIIILSNRIDSLNDWWDSSLRSAFDLHYWYYLCMFSFPPNCSAWPWFVCDLLLNCSALLRGLSNLSWHEILDDLPNTWEMRHRNCVAFVPWPCKVTLTCCSATPTGGVRNTPTRSFWRYAGSMKTRQFWVKRRISITDRNCELCANEARVACWTWYVSTLVLTRWFSSLRSGWIGDYRVIIAVTQGCCYRMRCCNRRGCVRSWVSIFAWDKGESHTDDADVLSRSTIDTFHGRRYETYHGLLQWVFCGRCFWAFVSNPNWMFRRRII